MEYLLLRLKLSITFENLHENFCIRLMSRIKFYNLAKVIREAGP